MAEEYLDEAILKLKKQRMQEQFLEEIRENGLPEEFFQKVSISEGLAEIKIPFFLQDIPQEWVDRRYINDPQPQIIKTDKDMSVDFTCSVLEVVISPAQLKESVDAAQKGLLRFMPSAVFYNSGQEVIQGIPVCWYSYINTTFDNQKTFNMNFFAAMEKTVLFTLTCNYEQRQNWEVIAMYCIHTLKGRISSGQEG